MRKLFAALLSICLSAALLAGCSGSNGQTTAGQTTAGQASEPAQTAETAKDAASDEATAQAEEAGSSYERYISGVKTAPGEYIADLIKVAGTEDVRSWNSFSSNGTGFDGIYISIYEKMGTIESDGSLKLVLLKSIEQVDDVTYKCELWDFIKDTSGNNITSNDVKWSIQMRADEGRPLQHFQEIEIIDDYTFNIISSEPFGIGELNACLSDPIIVCQETYESAPDNLAGKPIGTGPYYVDEYHEGMGATFKVNEDYWYNNITDDEWLEANDTVITYQNFKEIQVDLITDATARAIALENGEVDACSKLNTADVSKYSPEEFTAVNIPENAPLAFIFNCSENSVCSDVNLRKAICYAIDSEGIALGMDVPTYTAYGIQPRMFDSPASWLSGREYLTYDVEKAKEYLAQSDYNGENIVLFFSSDGIKDGVMVMMQAQLREIGINLELRIQDRAGMESTRTDFTSWDISSDKYGGGTYLPNTLAKWYEKDFSKALAFGVPDEELCKRFEDLRDIHDEASIDAWDDYFTNEMCYGYAIAVYDNQTACTSKYAPVLATDKNNVCPGAFGLAD